MVIPLRKQATDEHGPDSNVTPNWEISWDGGAMTSARARHAASAFLERTRQSGLISPTPHDMQNVQLVVSELVTNVLRHTSGTGSLRIELAPDGTQARITVRDTSSCAPRVLERDPGRLGGHGLEIVEAVSRSLSVEPGPDGTGKTIIVNIPLTPAEPANNWSSGQTRVTGAGRQTARSSQDA
ncbi:ATP-binding protein [Streptomyces sp. NPDC086783]|uniref:ATP-binding protein n=1 Tax=Streptomyces sp. NPDC086783 TaxID=3365758 RepID=UPI003811D510